MLFGFCGFFMLAAHAAVKLLETRGSFLTAARTFAQPNRPRENRHTARIAATKTAGFACTLLFLAGVYAIFPEYRRPFYLPFLKVATALFLPILLLSFPYFYFSSKSAADPFDEYWHFGLVCIGRRGEADAGMVRAHAYAWCVKGFFLPFMVGGIAQAVPQLIGGGGASPGIRAIVASLASVLFALDVTLASVGYVCTFKTLGTQIRSVEPTVAGWLVALICYPPFVRASEYLFPAYRDGPPWDQWLDPASLLFPLWACAILVSLAIYVWATAAFGLRFSNLTNRGIIRHGPYAWIKHPAYVSKNIFWWLSFVPFAGRSFSQALVACSGLLIVNAIYFARAKTEERHLSKDPDYRIYARWVQRYGLCAKLGDLWQKYRART